MKQSELTTEINAIAEQSYSQLDGEWADWLAVARRYEHKVPSQDRYDIRHSIILELAKARQRDGKPLPLLRAYRIASLIVALYWREQAKHLVKVCLYSGLPVEPHCATCRHKLKAKECPYLALRPPQSLDSEVDDSEASKVRLKDTIADDKAIDLDAWLDASTWLLGYPKRLVDIATKRRDGIPLNRKEQTYFNHYQARQLKKTQTSLF